MAIYSTAFEIYRSGSKLWVDQQTRHRAKRLHPTRRENVTMVNNVHRTRRQNHKKRLSDQIFCASIAFNRIVMKNTQNAVSTVQATFMSGFTIWPVFWGVEFPVCLTWKLSSQCVCVSILKLQIRRLHWALRRTRTKTHISIYIIIWHCTQQIADVLAPYMQTDTRTYCRLYTFFFFQHLPLLCAPHSTHTHSSGSFTVLPHRVSFWSFDWLPNLQAALISCLHFFFLLRSYSYYWRSVMGTPL